MFVFYLCIGVKKKWSSERGRGILGRGKKTTLTQEQKDQMKRTPFRKRVDTQIRDLVQCSVPHSLMHDVSVTIVVVQQPQCDKHCDSAQSRFQKEVSKTFLTP